MSDFLEQDAGQGYENVTQQDTATPLLLISQALSSVVDEGKVQVGHFYNSVTGEDYGDSINIIACHYRKMWYEWLPDQQGLAGIYEPNTVEVTGDKYTGMTRVDNGHAIEEKMVFLVLLADRLEEGYMVLGSTRGAIKYYKSWLTQMQTLTLPSGNVAPMFGGIWNVTIHKDISKKTGKPYYSPNNDGRSSFKFVKFIDDVVYKQVKEARNMASIAYKKQDTQLIEQKADVEQGF